jgi:DNA-binding XRE family transcriptional regulator
MTKQRILYEKELSAYAKQCREKAGKTRAQAAREMGVSQPSVFYAEERIGRGLLKLRIQMIEAYSPSKVVGPVFILKSKRAGRRR